MIMVMALMMVLWPLMAHALSVSVSWTPNTEPDVAGYRLYMGFLSCTAVGPMLPVTALGKVSTYTTSVPDGTTVVSVRMTAVDVAGNESAQSACVEKVFPAPIVDTVTPRLDVLEADMALVKAKLDRLKAGWCALKGSSLTKDVLAERAALGGCP